MYIGSIPEPAPGRNANLILKDKSFYRSLQSKQHPFVMTLDVFLRRFSLTLVHGPALTVHWTVIHYRAAALCAARNRTGLRPVDVGEESPKQTAPFRVLFALEAPPGIELPFPGVNHYILLYRFYFLTTYGMYDPYNPLSSTVLLPNSSHDFWEQTPGVRRVFKGA